MNLAVDGDGNVHAVWTQPTAVYQGDVGTNRFDAASDAWGTVGRLENRKDEGSSANIAVDTRGRALAVWDEGNEVSTMRLSNFRGPSDLELPCPSSQLRALALKGLNL